MQPQPFVGICSAGDQQDHAQFLQHAETIAASTGYFLMSGLKNAKSNAARPGAWRSLRPFMHCTLAPGQPVEQFEPLIYKVLQTSQHFVRGLQLNVLPWMEADFAPLWTKLKMQHPNLALVLQAHAKIMQEHAPQQIAQRLRGLPVDYVMFDISQSRGLPYNLAHMRQYVDAVYQQNLPIGVVVAGGLGGDVMEELFKPLAAEYPNLSCDAFGKLQDSTGQKLSWPAVDEYLAEWKACIPEVPGAR